MNEAPSEKNKVLTPTVLKLGFVSFFADVASEMLYPITPIFLTVVLGASMTSLGLIEGLAEAMASLMKTYSGLWSDKIQKRKPFVLWGYFLGAVAKPVVGASSGVLQVLCGRLIDRTGKGLRSAPRDALISDSVAAAHRGAAFGWHRGMDTLGAAVGPLLALYFLSLNQNNLRQLYYWALVPGLISVAIVFLVKERHVPIVPNNSQTSFNWFQDFKNINSNFRMYLISLAAFSVTNSSDVFLLLKAKNSGVSTENTILMYCGYNLIYSLLSPYLGKLSDKLSRKKILVFGLSVFVLVYLGFSFATELHEFAILFLIYGLYMAATDGVSKALVVDLAPANLKATYLGLQGTVAGVCTVVASTTAGLLWDHFGSSWAFVFGAAGGLISILLLLNVSTECFDKKLKI